MACAGCLAGTNLDAHARKFQHQPLADTTWIRLLKIHPDLVHNSISCTLEHFHRNSCPDYVALSYEWGDPTPTHTVYVNGGSRRIHTNLWNFLAWSRAAQSHDAQDQDYLWTDSLCLDQANHGELNIQVARMGDTYSRARSVTIWLGENKTMAEALENWPTTRSRCDEVGMQYMRHLVSNSYWGRVWITQEVAQARQASVVCGGTTTTADFDALAQSVRHAWSQSRYGRLDLALLRFLALSDARRRLRARDALAFWDLVRAFVQSESTLAVDAVYGLVGLARALCPSFRDAALGVDYAKLPEDVLWDTMWEQSPLRRAGGLQLGFALLQHRLLPGAPWCGRFRELAARLRAYAARPTTSPRHRSQAGVALRVLRAFCVLKTHLAGQGAQHDALLRLGEGALWSAQRQIPQPTFLHHAVALGVALSDDHRCTEDSPWQCASHHALAVAGREGNMVPEVLRLQESGGGGGGGGHHKWTCPYDVARALCSASSEGCSASCMVLSIPAAGLKVQWAPEQCFRGGQLRIDGGLAWTFTTLRHGTMDDSKDKRAWQDSWGRVLLRT